MAPASHPTPPAHQGLVRRFALAFLVFGVCGSLLLLAWLRHLERRQSAEVFLALAQNDADFVRELRLPRSEKLASDLGRLLKMEIFFRDQTGAHTPAVSLPKLPTDGVVHQLEGQREAVAMRLDDTHDILFVRPTQTLAASVARPGTLGALVIFWLLSLALAWAVARQVVRPITGLTRVLPRLFDETPPALPEAERPDEIGQIARGLLDARVRLLDERQRREQSEKLALLGRMATGLAHEIKNPVASIQLHAQLTDDPTLGSEARRSLEMIQSESRVIEGLVNQWLYVARPAPPGTSLLNLREVLLQTVEILGAQAAHADVGIKLRFQAEMPVRGDRQRLVQAFRNLALNAIQAMPTGGTLTLAAHIESGQVHLTFTDTGRGFSERALQSGVELFYSEREGGLGIGLNVAREVITHHGGQMSLRNVTPHGAEVHITLPITA